MARKMQRLTRRPAFFKPLKGDFSQQLRIPSGFIKKLKGCSPHRLKGPSGECWNVELEKRGNQLFFHRGWEKFVQRHPLEAGDFLIFIYDGVSMFNVRIYSKTFCEKNLNAAKTPKSRRESNGNAAKRSDKLPKRSSSDAVKRRGVDEDDEEQEVFTPFHSENPFVYRTLRTNSLYEVYVPREVVRMEGYKVGMIIEIMDTFGMSWKVALGGSPDAGRVLMTGLQNICRANQTSAGDTVVFEFVKPRVAQLHVIKAGSY